ncbi:DUF2269 domain-containing protein [Corynebacterium hindlerae]|uniref:DUF2269 domain-containing protein n=1 Tax=Corynebacterium hindlerae TaxID=699041 RepID=A0A7G5FEK6_9CORY|nr:DUF2269 domain-containing protein [Corynebacterium hindlerae]QMV85047.1 DUF2269 domain-containing protein [Corynebacterium hindlerae]
MDTIMTALHILSAVLFLGPVTVATSTFHAKALAAHSGDDTARGAAKLLHNISSTYGMLSLLVPLLGVGVFMTDSAYLKQGQYHAAVGLSVVAWAVLFFLILPRQKKMLGALGLLDADEVPADTEIADWNKAKGQLSMFGGIFALLWFVTAILMFI